MKEKNNDISSNRTSSIEIKRTIEDDKRMGGKTAYSPSTICDI